MILESQPNLAPRSLPRDQNHNKLLLESASRFIEIAFSTGSCILFIYRPLINSSRKRIQLSTNALLQRKPVNLQDLDIIILDKRTPLFYDKASDLENHTFRCFTLFEDTSCKARTFTKHNRIVSRCMKRNLSLSPEIHDSILHAGGIIFLGCFIGFKGTL